MKLVNRYALIVCAAVGLFSCNDDETPTTPDNKFSLGATDYKITNGLFIKDVEPGMDNDGNEYYRNELTFTGDGITITEVDGEVTGSGQGSYATLLINNAGRELQTGTYTWQAEENEQPFDLWAGNITIDWQKGTQTDYLMTSGTLTVSRTGTSYKATFEGVAYPEDMINGGIVSGSSPLNVKLQFEGSLLAFDAD
jgi:hypothetical protein